MTRDVDALIEQIGERRVMLSDVINAGFCSRVHDWCDVNGVDFHRLRSEGYSARETIDKAGIAGEFILRRMARNG